MTILQACREAIKQSKNYSYGWYVCFNSQMPRMNWWNNYHVQASYMVWQNMDGTYPRSVYFFAHHGKLFRVNRESK